MPQRLCIFAQKCPTGFSGTYFPERAEPILPQGKLKHSCGVGKGAGAASLCAASMLLSLCHFWVSESGSRQKQYPFPPNPTGGRGRRKRCHGSKSPFLSKLVLMKHQRGKQKSSGLLPFTPTRTMAYGLSPLLLFVCE